MKEFVKIKIFGASIHDIVDITKQTLLIVICVND